MFRGTENYVVIMEAVVMNKLGDLIINGYGSANGGEFDRVVINGKGTVNGQVDCTLLECNGTGSITGDVKSEKVKISGNGKITGNVLSQKLIIEGRASILGDAQTTNMIIQGKATINGHVKGEELKVQGSITIGKDCEVEIFKSEGQFSIGGLLSADDIYIEIFGECKANEIGGKTIRVKQKSSILLSLIKTIRAVNLVTDLIEGDHIELENTKAKIVRGNNIIIGENCEIDLVEYKETYQLDKNGRVKESVKL
jgi:cytoskeletal protein CcmA (bactofilin family)